MSITRFDPFAELTRMREELDGTLGRMFPRTRGGGGDWLPLADVTRHDGAMRIALDLPGLKPEDVKVEITDNQLCVSGERHEEHEETREGVYSRERSFGSFTRTFTLPAGTSASAIEAEFADGELRITIPLPTDTAPRTVEVKTREVATAA